MTTSVSVAEATDPRFPVPETDRSNWPAEGPWAAEPDRVDWRFGGLRLAAGRLSHGGWGLSLVLPDRTRTAPSVELYGLARSMAFYDRRISLMSQLPGLPAGYWAMTWDVSAENHWADGTLPGVAGARRELRPFRPRGYTKLKDVRRMAAVLARESGAKAITSPVEVHDGAAAVLCAEHPVKYRKVVDPTLAGMCRDWVYAGDGNTMAVAADWLEENPKAVRPWCDRVRNPVPNYLREHADPALYALRSPSGA